MLRPCALVLALLPSALWASDACTIETDITEVYEVRERSLPLASYTPLELRAASGRVRCEPDDAEKRYVCRVEGKGELFVEGGERAAMAVIFHTSALGEAHFYPSGNVSCGLAADFE